MMLKSDLKPICIGFVSLGTLLFSPANAREIFVAPAGNDANSGEQSAPYKTISKAALEARAGDTVTVRAGIYREWVSPKRGGKSAEEPIIYQAAEGEDVRILGSEKVTGWQRVEDSLWQTEIDNDLLGKTNPFAAEIRHPEYVEEDEAGDGWGWLKYGRWAHRGDVFLNGDGLRESETKDDLTKPMHWSANVQKEKTVLTVNFGDVDPNTNEIEIAVRPYAFYPRKSGLSFITVRGFKIMNVANHWAPPTKHQPGAIGPNGGHNWTIEDNVIVNVRTVCISLGLPTGNANFSKRGNHIVRNNAIRRCGQSGITGQSWNIRSRITGNHISEINHRREFGGWETAGIKFHNAHSVLIEGNFVDGVYTQDPKTGSAHGIWIDYQNKFTRASKNIIRDAQSDAILFEANWEGPSLFDNNIVIGGTLATASSRGETWSNNLFIETGARWENQDWGDRVSVKNATWTNNIFLGGGLHDAPIEKTYKLYNNVYANGAEPSSYEADARVEAGLVDYAIYTRDNKLVLELNMAPVADDDFSDDLDSVPGAVKVASTYDFFNKKRQSTRQPGPFSSTEENHVIWQFNANSIDARQLVGAVQW